MMLLTVGTQLPFDRMVKLVDTWAGAHPEVEIFSQIADGQYIPKHMQYTDYLDSKQYGELFEKADGVIAHAGMGTVISALMAAKPVIVFPRKASLGEHRNEHQLATCDKLSFIQGCHIAYKDAELTQLLDQSQTLKSGNIAPYANADLLGTIDNFIGQ